MKINLRLGGIELARIIDRFEFLKWNKGTCSSIAVLRKYDSGFNLVSIGDRLVDLSKEERDNLFTIYKIFIENYKEDEDSN